VSILTGERLNTWPTAYWADRSLAVLGDDAGVGADNSHSPRWLRARVADGISALRINGLLTAKGVAMRRECVAACVCLTACLLAVSLIPARLLPACPLHVTVPADPSTPNTHLNRRTAAVS